MSTRKSPQPSPKPGRPTLVRGEDRPAESRNSDSKHAGQAGGANQIYGLMPVLEALRTGNHRLEQITVAEGARHERLRELLDLAKHARVPVHRAPRFALDRSLPGVTHQGVIARTAAATYSDADDLLDDLGARVGTTEPPLVLGLDAVEDPRNLGAILRTAECAGKRALILERRALA